MTPRPREREAGVVLVNVLAVMALASTAVFMMISLQETAVHRSQRFSEAAQAIAYAMGGETSAIVALRRDAREAPDIDHFAEPWAAVIQTDTPIQSGRFSLAIEDAESRFNVNSLERGGVLAEETFRRILVALDLPESLAEPVAEWIRTFGPVRALGDLSAVGLPDGAVERMSLLVDALPARTEVNINSADEALLGILLNNVVAGRVLASLRSRKGFLTRENVASRRVILPPGIDFTSDHYRVTVDVTVGRTRQRLTSLLQRRREDNRIEVAPVSRVRGAAGGPSGD